MEREFNLIDEKWICVMDNKCDVREISLKDALLNAHEYKCLAGETKTQDVVILRLLLAIMYTVFSRYDVNGTEIDVFEDIDIPVDTWEELWSIKRIPEQPIVKYLTKWYDRFWLFDKDYPFFQSNTVKGKSKPCSTAKMIGSLFESNNKKRLFSDRQDSGRLLSFSEAARWLLHMVNFDDIAAKQPTPKKTWTGKLGLVYLEGKNLFETIMLNYVANADANRDVYICTPSWESDDTATEFNRIIAVPDNQAALLTVQWRRLYLVREDSKVCGYYLAGGDYFEDEEVFSEQMTIWREIKDKKGVITGFKPMRHVPSRRAWQEFGPIAAVSPEKENSSFRHAPGVVEWLRYLQSKGIIEKNYFARIATVAVIYDYGQKASLPVMDCISDGLSFHSQLLLDAGRVWRARINEEITKCEDAAKAVSYFSIDLQKAAGASGEKLSGDESRMLFYDNIDRPFRLWLSGVDTDSDISYIARLENELYRIAVRMGNDMAEKAGENAVFGRRAVNDGFSGSIHSSAEALNLFVYKIKKIFNKAGDNNNGEQKQS